MEFHTPRLIECIMAEVANAKLQFEQDIVNKSFTLEERWGSFITAPNYLKNHEDYITRFEEFGYDGDNDHDRGYVVDAEQIVGSVKDDEFGEVYPEFDWVDSSIYHNFPDSDNVKAFKEHLLSMNFGSYKFDW